MRVHKSPSRIPDGAVHSPRVLSGWVLLWVCAFAGVATLLQWSIPFPVDDDTAYHFSVAALMQKYGTLHSFPWTPFSWQFSHYADKQYFFHLLFLPFINLGFLTSQRIVGAIAETLVLLAVFWVLRAERVRFAGVWTLVVLTSGVFMFRFAEVRPHLLSIALASLLVWALIRARWVMVAAIGVLYPLSYVAFWQIPLLLVVAVEVARWFARQPIRFTPAAVLVAAIGVGVLLHPNRWNLVQLNWIHMTDILYNTAWRRNEFIDLGNEYQPLPAASWIRFLPRAVMFSVSALMLSLSARKRDPGPIALSLAALMFAAMTVMSARFVEYFVPFSVLAFALATRESRSRLLLPLVVLVSLVCAVALEAAPYRYLSSLESRNNYIDANTERVLREKIPVGMIVFTCGWEFTGSLMVAMPERRFIVAEDPTLLYKQDAQLYNAWHSLPLTPVPDAASVIRQHFKSPFVVCRNVGLYATLLDELRKDPSVETVFVNERWVVFDLVSRRKALQAR